MNSRHRENNPFRDIHRVVADPFKVLGDHQKIQGLLPAGRVFRYLRYQLLFHLRKVVIHYIILRDDQLCQLGIPPHIGIHAFGHHLNGVLGHLPQQGAVGALTVHIGNDLRDILRLVANAFHVGDHL